MATSFIVNLEDLKRILSNIKIAEAHAAGGNLVDLVNQAAGGVAAPITPFGLRTVDGSYNHLLPGDTSVGAADTLFPRLLDPTWRNETGTPHQDQITLPGGGPTITNNNYDSARSVADADPRIISNLIVDTTINNPAALDAALRLAVPDTVAPADVNAWIASTAVSLVSAYNLWKAADVASDAQWTAIAGAYTSAITDAATVTASTTTALSSLNALITALSDDDPNNGDLAFAQAAKAAADAAVLAQSAVIDALDRDPGTGDDLPELGAANVLLAKLQALAAAADAAVHAFDNGSVGLSEYNAMFAAQSKALEANGLASTNATALTAAKVDAENHSKSALDTAFKALVANAGLDISSDNSIMIPHQSADIGLSPPNSGWMTLFGQFFDHGLDLVTKGGNGTVYMPLKADDPLYDKGWDGQVGALRQKFDPLGNLLFKDNLTNLETTSASDANGDANTAVMVNDDGWGADGIFNTYDDRPNFMALTRATQMDAARNTQNTTTPFVDQNQTYTSSASHQVFLREYVADETGHAINSGRLLNDSHGGVATWADVKAQALNLLGLKLADSDVHDVPLLDVDQYGNFNAGPNGYAQVWVKFQEFVPNPNFNPNPGPGFDPNPFIASGTSVIRLIEGTSTGLDLSNVPVPADVTASAGGSILALVAHTGHAFLNDIAHHAAPGSFDSNGDGFKDAPQIADDDTLDYNGDGQVNQLDVTLAVRDGKLTDANGDTVIDINDLKDVNLDGVIDAKDTIADDRNPTTYDDEMLAAHFITGDGRGNENIGLTAVHNIFHSEHNRVLEANKVTLINSFDVAAVNEWLRADSGAQTNQVTQAQLDVIKVLTGQAQVDAVATLIQQLDAQNSWNGDRLFQAARFTTEMQYQHMVFEEFARRVQPNVDPFVFTNSADIDPSIVAEFAHVVYRFGHSQLTDAVDRLTNNLDLVSDPASPNGQIGLIQAFLNPQSFVASGVDAEAATGAIIRGMTRQVGNEIDEFVVESLRNNLVGLPLDLAALNMARGRDTGVPGLNEARTQLYAASGHVDVKPYTSWQDFANNLKHPLSVVNFIAAYGTHSTITSATTLDDKRDAAFKLVFGGSGAPADRLDFVNAQGTYAGGSLGGLNAVDFWIGGLAEKHPEFGGQLGSTFNFVFEYQLEQLQNGDRFYYLSRTQGMNLLNLLEGNTFADIIMRNTDLGDLHATHLAAEVMEVPDMILELDTLAAQSNYGDNPSAPIDINAPGYDRWALDPTWETGPTSGNSGPKVIRIMDDKDSNGNTVDVRYKDVVIDYDNRLEFFGGEHVVLGGSEGRDVLLGDKGIDTLWGDGGDDYLNAGTESDQVFGGDGDDIIEDPFGDDFLRGEAGDDVIVNSAGLDIDFGGTGNDFMMAVTDSTEMFAGPGDDFLLGGTAPDGLLGNEGDDWIEGGEGFDSLSGENSELFFNSPIVGHDILWGQGNDTDYDGENGDDIMVQGSGIQRNNGMEGFDWAIHKGDTKADGTATDAVTDMSNLLGAGAVNPAFILRDRFDSVEGLSGWNGNDQLSGASTLIVAGGGFDSKLTQAGVDRINGLKYIIGNVGDGVDPLTNTDASAVVLTSQHAHDGGEIILGGAGSDIMMGALGDDIMDGDAWLNVRISVHQNKVPVGVNNQDITGNPEVASFNSLTEQLTWTGSGLPANWEFVRRGDQGQVIHTGLTKSLAELMREGIVNPGQLKAVREVLNSDGSHVGAAGSSNNFGATGDVDIAVFRDVRANYTIEGVDLNNDGQIAGLEIQDTNNDGYIRVAHTPPGGGGGGGGGGGRLSDGIDQIRNFEVLEFSDSVEIIQNGITNNAATGAPNITINNGPNAFNLVGRLEAGDTLVADIGTVNDADGFNPATVTFTWQQAIVDNTGATIGWEDIVDPVNGNVITGTTFTPTGAFGLDGLQLRVVASFRDANGIPETRVSAPTDPVVGTAPTAPDPAAVLGLRTIAVDPNPTDGVVAGVLVDLTGTLDPAGDAVPQALDANNLPIPTFGIFEDGAPLVITKDQLLASVTDIDTANTALSVANLALRIRVGDPNPGTLVNNNNGTWTFTPAANFNGGVVFTYDVSDGTNPAVPVEATLDVLAVNDVPVEIADVPLGSTLAGAGAAPVTFALADIFANFSGLTAPDINANRFDVDGDTVTLVAGSVVLANPAQGTLVDNNNGTWTFTANPGFNGNVVVNFQITDGTGSANDPAVSGAIANSTISLVNVAATGSAALSDTTPTQNVAISAQTLGITDPNGVGALSYQWQISANGVTGWTNTGGSTANPNFTPGAATVGQFLRVVASFTDGGGTVETITSTASTRVVGSNQTGNGLANTLSGNAGDDILTGNGGADTLTGNAGDDRFNYTIGDGADTVDGGADFDTIAITGTALSDTLGVVFNGTALTQIAGGNITNIEAVSANLLGGLNDVLDYTGSLGAVTVNLAAGSASGFASISNIESVTGGAGNDTITGSAGANALNGGLADDTLSGGAGNDTITYAVTTSGAAVTSGRDFVDGGTTALDVNNRDTGSDTFVLNGSAAAETFKILTRAAALANGIAVNNANTEILITRQAGNGVVGFANLQVLAELDNIEEIQVNTLNVTANNNNGGLDSGGTNGDTVQIVGNFGTSTNATTSLNFSTITVNSGSAGDTVDISQLASDHRIVFNGGGGSDLIIGATRPQDVLTGPVTKVTNIASNNADTFYGLNGTYTFAGLKGNDVYIIDANDKVIERNNEGADEVRSASINLDLAKYTYVEKATLLGDQALSARGTDGGNILDGEQNSAGNALTGLGGNDLYIVGADDTVIEARSGGTDTVASASISLDLAQYANIENLSLLGSANLNAKGNSGANVIVGNAGDNVITGGAGWDTLTGNGGNDVFRFERGFGNDHVTDFDANAVGGQDKLDISAFGITASTFSNQVRVWDLGASTMVTVGGFEHIIYLDKVADHTSVTINDFVLFGAR